MTPKTVWWLAAALAVICASWVITHFPAQDDITWFFHWARAAQTYGYLDLKQYTSFNYFPLFLVILWLSNLGEAALVWLGAAPLFPHYWRFFNLLIQLGLSYWFIILLRPYLSPRAQQWLPWLVLFNPVFIWIVWVWGQVDLLIILPWLMSLIFLVQKRYIWFVVVTLVALGLKPTGVLFLPLQTLLLIGQLVRDSHYKGWLKYGTPGILLGVIMAAPFLPVLVDKLTQQAAWTQDTAVTYNAFNVWFLGRHVGPAQEIWHGLSYQLWGAVIFGLAAITISHFFFHALQKQLSQYGRLLLFASFAFVYAFAAVMLLTDMHERYWDFSLGLLLVAALLHPLWRPLFLFLSITFFLNIALVFPAGVTVFNQMQQAWNLWGETLSWLHVIVFVVIVMGWIRLTTSDDLINVPSRNKENRIYHQPATAK